MKLAELFLIVLPSGEFSIDGRLFLFKEPVKLQAFDETRTIAFGSPSFLRHKRQYFLMEIIPIRILLRREFQWVLLIIL